MSACWEDRLANMVQFLKLLTKHGRIEVNVDMNSLIAQASCAERDGGNTDVCKVRNVFLAQSKFLFFFLVKALWSFSHRL